MQQCVSALSGLRIKSLFIGLTLSFLTCCAASNASINQTQNNQSENNRPKVVQRTIDWPAAQKLANRHSDIDIAQNKLSPVRKSVTAGTKLAVPLMLLPASYTSSVTLLSAFRFSSPLLLQTATGYTVVYKSSQVDVVVDASNAMMQTAGNRETVQQDFDGQYQHIEGGGGEKTIGRFGALYSVQLMCNKPAIPQCVTEAMLDEVINGLDVYPASVLSR